MLFQSGMSWPDVRRAIGRVAEANGEWCGLPMPVEDLTLTIETRNPWRDRLEAIRIAGSRQARVCSVDDVDDQVAILNTFWSRRLGRDVMIYRDKTGAHVVYGPRTESRWKFLFNTIAVGASGAWSVEAELKAIERLETLIKPHLLELYMLTGMFVETSKRSQMAYIFRKGRPTAVLTPHKRDGQMTLLTTLCLHPIGYYSESFCGSMVPTDDVIAHLLLMRGDEKMYWRRANQHPPAHPEAGI